MSAALSLSSRAFLIACALLVAVLAPAELPANGAVQEPSDVPTNAIQAQVEAEESGERVEIESERQERATFYANPDGTQTFEIHPDPIRVRKDDEWAAIDTTLRQQADGTLVPEASTMDVELSGGGTGQPLLNLDALDGSFGVKAPMKLPSPTVEGNQATYSDVLPDVDLVMTVENTQVRQVFVVKTAEAAHNPALKELTFPVSAPNASVESSGNGVVVSNADGGVMFESAAPLMWDSSGTGTQVEADDRVLGPQEGDTVAHVDSEVDASGVTLTPDAGLLTGSKTEYPLYVDPTFGPNETGWAMVFKQNPNTSFWKWTDSNGQGVGYQQYEPTSTKRLFWSFPTSGIKGADIIDAQFKAYEVYAASCTPRAIRLYRSGTVGSNVNWNNQPTGKQYISERNVAYGRDGCSPGGAWVEWDATTAAQTAADHNLNAMGLALQVTNESDSLTWKRFKNNAVFTGRYNYKPYSPSAVATMANGANQGCSPTNAPDRISPGTSGVKARAKLSDRDGQNIRARVELYNYPIGSGEAPFRTITTSYRASGSVFDVDFPSGDVGNGRDIAWRIRAEDNINGSSGAAGAWSGFCRFVVDTTKPLPPIVTATSSTDPWPAGETRTFTVSKPPDSDIASYRMAIDGGGYGTARSLSTPITLTLGGCGPRMLVVQSIDAAGNVSATVVRVPFTITCQDLYIASRFRIREGEDQKTSSVTGSQSDIAWTGSGITWSKVMGDWKLKFNGTAAAKSNAVGLLDTQKSFLMSAWLEVGAVTTDMTAVSVDDPDASDSIAKLQVLRDTDEEENTAPFYVGRMRYVGAAPGFCAEPTFAVRCDRGYVVLTSNSAASEIGEAPVSLSYSYDSQELILWINGEVAVRAGGFAPGTNDDPAANNGNLRLGGPQSGSNFIGTVDDVITSVGDYSLDDASTAVHTLVDDAGDTNYLGNVD